jgi:hypothetical protein
VAKHHFPTSVLNLSLSNRELQEAVQIPDAFRNYLHSIKYKSYLRMREAKDMVQLAAAQAQLELIDELMLFIDAKDSFDDIID